MLHALDLNALKPEGYVSDFAHVIDPIAKQQMEQYLGAVEQSTGAQVAIVTIGSLEGDPIDDVAASLLRKWGIGKKGKDNGVLLLLAVNDRRSRIEVGYGLEQYLNDARDGDILRAMRPSLRTGNYGDALSTAAQAIGDRIAQGQGGTIQQRLPRRAAPANEGLPWPLLIFGLFFLLLLFRGMGGRGGRGGGGFLPGFLLGNVLGSGGGWGGGSRGGFGGADSGGGGGFGGFGGGDSGGGGASSDW